MVADAMEGSPMNNIRNVFGDKDKAPEAEVASSDSNSNGEEPTEERRHRRRYRKPEENENTKEKNKDEIADIRKRILVDIEKFQLKPTHSFGILPLKEGTVILVHYASLNRPQDAFLLDIDAIRTLVNAFSQRKE